MTPSIRTLSLSVLGILLVTALPAAAQTFAAPTTFGSGIDRKGIAAADYDGDGDVDFAVGGSAVTVYWSNGDLTGTFSTIPPSIQPFAYGGVDSGDFDNDGLRDIVAANGVSSPPGGAPGILFHWNQGGQTFTQTLSVTLPQFGTSDPLAGDLDGDGTLDLAFQFTVGGSIEVWSNDGSGALTPDGSYPRAGTIIQDMTLADVDNDGDLDLASGQFFGGGPASVRIRRNDGTGAFGTDEIVPVGGIEANGIEFADADADGDLDLFVARPDLDSVGLLTNDGTGSFGTATSVVTADNPWAVIGEDFDHDGLADLALTFSTGPGRFGALFNQGGGTYGGAEVGTVGNLPFELGHVDLDLDGDQEVVVINFDNLAIFENLTVDPAAWTDLGGSTEGIAGHPRLVSTGTLVGGSPASVTLTRAPTGAIMLAWIAFAPAPFAALGGTVHAFPFNSQLTLFSNAAGSFSGATTWPLGVPSGTEVTFQFLLQDTSTVHGITISNGLRATAP